jgi:DNA-binding MarR family transcriptional regulator
VQTSLGSKKSGVPTGELAQQLAGFFRYVTHVNVQDLLPEISELDLSLTQLKALSLLDERSDELSVKDLAEGLGLSVAATSRAVDCLFRRELVEREEDRLDRRVRRVRLAPAGRRTVESVIAMRVAGLERVVAGLTEDERRKLARALEPILQREEIRRFLPRKRAR